MKILQKRCSENGKKSVLKELSITEMDVGDCVKAIEIQTVRAGQG